jgi:hypothetical protein
MHPLAGHVGSRIIPDAVKVPGSGLAGTWISVGGYALIVTSEGE